MVIATASGSTAKWTSARRPRVTFLGITVGAVLLDRMLDVLPGQVVLQLRCCNRDAIEEQAQVKCLVRFRIEGQLTGDSQAVGVIVGDQLRRYAERWLPVGEPDLDILIANPVPENIDRAALIDLLSKPLSEPLARTILIATMGLHELVPVQGLGRLDEGEQLHRVEANPPVEGLTHLWPSPNLASAVTALGDKVSRNLIFEQLLADRTHIASGISS